MDLRAVDLFVAAECKQHDEDDGCGQQEIGGAKERVGETGREAGCDVPCDAGRDISINACLHDMRTVLADAHGKGEGCTRYPAWP